MSKLMKITGTWRGTYSYEPSEHLPAREPVSFTLALKQGWFGRFKGRVEDDSSRGMPGTGTITGHLSFPRISFTKQMPVGYVAAPDGRSISLRQFLAEHGHSYEQDFPHAPILYEGMFSSSERAQGTWIIKPHVVRLGDGRIIKMLGGKGSWSMDKHSD